MTYADQKLVASVKADPSPKNVAEMVTEVYKMNVGQINSIECLTSGQKLLTDAHTELVKAVGVIQTQIKDEIHPKLEKLSESERWGKLIIRGSMSIIAACGLAVGTWVWTQAPSAAWVVSLTENKVREIAKAEASDQDKIILARLDAQDKLLRDEVGKQTSELLTKLEENSHRIDGIRVEFRDSLSSAFATHQNWEANHPRPAP